MTIKQLHQVSIFDNALQIEIFSAHFEKNLIFNEILSPVEDVTWDI